MIYNYYFEEDIHKDSVNELVERLWDKDTVKLYFATFGGEVYTLRKQKIDYNKLVSFTEEENKIFAKKLKQKEILTDKQIKQFLKGEDVIVYREQILKIKK